jgi:hypothetical protein
MNCLEKQAWEYFYEINQSSSLKAFYVLDSSQHLIVMRKENSPDETKEYLSLKQCNDTFALLLFPWKQVNGMGMMPLKRKPKIVQKINFYTVPSILEFIGKINYPYTRQLKNTVNKRQKRIFFGELYRKALSPCRFQKFLENGGNFDEWV